MMSEKKSTLLSLVFIGLAVTAGTALFSGWSPVGASGDHDDAREMRSMGDIIPLAMWLEQAGLLLPALPGQNQSLAADHPSV